MGKSRDISSIFGPKPAQLAKAFKISRQVLGLLDKTEKKKGAVILTGMVLSGALEVISLGAILGLLYLAGNSAELASMKYVSQLYAFSGLSATGFVSLAMSGLVALFVFKNAVHLLIVRAQSRFAFAVGLNLISGQLAKHLDKPYLFFKENNSNRIAQNCMSIPLEFSSQILMPGLNILNEVFVMVLIFAGVMLYAPVVSLLLLLTVAPMVLVFMLLIRKKIAAAGAAKNRERPKGYNALFSMIHGIEDVLISQNQWRFAKTTLHHFSRFFYHTIRLQVFEAIPARLIEVVAVVAVAVLYFFSLATDPGGGSLLPLVVAFATAAYRLMPSFNRIMSAAVKIRGAGYVFDVLYPRPAPRKSQENSRQDALPFTETIRLKHLGFTYKGSQTPALSDISIEIRKGSCIGIMGESGSGKSTLARVLAGLIPADRGILEIDGVAVTEVNKKAWMQNIGYVSQDVFINEGSLADNITFGAAENNAAHLRAAVRMAALEKFVSGLPSGENSPLSEFGKNISGGQKQRIAIARALFKDAGFLIFDEATSALDGETERSIIDTIRALRSKGVTMVIVAHRLSSLAHCDRVIRMDKGKVVQEFKPEDIQNLA